MLAFTLSVLSVFFRATIKNRLDRHLSKQETITIRESKQGF